MYYCKTKDNSALLFCIALKMAPRRWRTFVIHYLSYNKIIFAVLASIFLSGKGRLSILPKCIRSRDAETWNFARCRTITWSLCLCSNSGNKGIYCSLTLINSRGDEQRNNVSRATDCKLSSVSSNIMFFMQTNSAIIRQMTLSISFQIFTYEYTPLTIIPTHFKFTYF